MNEVNWRALRHIVTTDAEMHESLAQKSAADGNDHGIEWHSCKAGVYRSVLESMDHLEDVHAPIVVPS